MQFNKVLLKFYHKHKYYSYAVPVIISIIILLIIGKLTNVFNDIYYWIGALIMIFQIVIITFIYFESLEFRIKEFKEHKRQKEYKKAVRIVTHKPIFSQFKQLNDKGNKYTYNVFK